MSQKTTTAQKLLLGIGVMAIGAPAFAVEGAIDVSGAVSIIGGLTAAVAAIGAAKLAPAATSVAFKWVKGAIFS
ncbi:hypothetical protein C9J12_22685 [Photobacterium frigidiphilum]|uniref:Methyltransferase n=1 Tax=Photobacterium frigidiphilum TaxID=264736 RepID=A0A2T3J9D1_9GAMM|nr:major capsid protein [Photobacterium frigidiphilum]PSU45376.1 hypothetical protein C9J12_22685 [Photobacterium frigidiphilum]